MTFILGPPKPRQEARGEDETNSGAEKEAGRKRETESRKEGGCLWWEVIIGPKTAWTPTYLLEGYLLKVFSE